MKYKNKIKLVGVSTAALMALSISASAQTVQAGGGVNLNGTGNITNAPIFNVAPLPVDFGDSNFQDRVLPIAHFTGLDKTGTDIAFGNLIPLKAPSISIMVGDGTGSEATNAPMGAGTTIDDTGISTVDSYKVVDGGGVTLTEVNGTGITTDGTVSAGNATINEIVIGGQSLTVIGGSLYYGLTELASSAGGTVDFKEYVVRDTTTTPGSWIDTTYVVDDSGTAVITQVETTVLDGSGYPASSTTDLASTGAGIDSSKTFTVDGSGNVIGIAYDNNNDTIDDVIETYDASGTLLSTTYTVESLVAAIQADENPGLSDYTDVGIDVNEGEDIVVMNKIIKAFADAGETVTTQIIENFVAIERLAFDMRSSDVIYDSVASSFTVQMLRNRLSSIDTTYTVTVDPSNGGITRIETDIDRDGTVDQISEHTLNAQGLPLTSSSDLTADSSIDRITHYTYDVDGNVSTISTDANANGIIDSITTVVSRTVNPDGSVTVISENDTNADGNRNTADFAKYDEFGRRLVFGTDNNFDGLRDSGGYELVYGSNPIVDTWIKTIYGNSDIPASIVRLDSTIWNEYGSRFSLTAATPAGVPTSTRVFNYNELRQQTFAVAFAPSGEITQMIYSLFDSSGQNLGILYDQGNTGTTDTGLWQTASAVTLEASNLNPSRDGQIDHISLTNVDANITVTSAALAVLTSDGTHPFRFRATNAADQLTFESDVSATGNVVNFEGTLPHDEYETGAGYLFYIQGSAIVTILP